MSGHVGGPAPNPCASCPYRCDVPSGIWAAEEYDKLAAYDADTAYQPPNLFLCHQTGADDAQARLCAGWVGCHGDELLALRLAACRGSLTGDALEAAFTYSTDVPLFASGAAARAHGVRDIESPDPTAVRAMAKIARRRDLAAAPQGGRRSNAR